MKTNNNVPYVMLLLAFIGICIAFYDSFAIYTNRLLWCPPPIDGCNIVAFSPFARVFNIPLGYFGLVFYLSMFSMVALLAYDPLSPGLQLGSFLLAVFGILLSIGFMFIQITLIKAFCVYCLISFILCLFLFVLAFYYFKNSQKQIIPGSNIQTT